jgi:hypothetical protein
MIRDHRDYIIGIVITSLVGATAVTFGPSANDDFPLAVDIILGTVLILITSSVIGVVILGISWIFTKTFTFQRFVRITAGVCITWTLVTVVGVIMQMAR